MKHTRPNIGLSPFVRFATENETKRCTVEACGDRRSGLSSFCKRHRQLAYRHGHPCASLLRRKEYALELKEVAAFLHLHSRHQAVRAALIFLHRELVDAAAERLKRGTVGQLQYQKLQGMRFRSGVTALDILQRTTATWLHLHRYPWHRSYTEQQLLLTQGRVALFAPTVKGVRYGDSERRSKAACLFAGRHLRDTLGVFWDNVVCRVELEHNTTELLARKFELPTSAKEAQRYLPLGTPTAQAEKLINEYEYRWVVPYDQLPAGGRARYKQATKLKPSTQTRGT